VYRPSPHRVFTALALCAGVAAGPLAAAAAAAGPDFVDTQIPTTGSHALSMPTTITPILNTGRAFILDKTGAVRILSADGTVVSADALDVTVCSNSEEGLLGIAVDPGFATNGFVYIYYTRNTAGSCTAGSGAFNRVSRFKMAGPDPLTSNTIDPTSELILLDNMNVPAGNHNGGDLHIGNDGDLYVSVGDGGVNPRGTAGVSAGQDLSVLNGKILRITTTGGVPADNPLVGQPNAQPCAKAGIGAPTTAKCTEIYDDGLRNPYRIAFDPNTFATRFYINDVGEATWEEVDLGGKGLNYGWNSREGFCAEVALTDCRSTPGFTDPMTGFTDPLTAYNHSTGCFVITAGAFIPNVLWGPAYDGGYLFADGGCGKIWFMNASGAVDYSLPFATTSGTLVDMAFLTQGGQTGLYYVTNGSNQLHRIAAVPGTVPPEPTTTQTTPAPPPTTTSTATTAPTTLVTQPVTPRHPTPTTVRCTVPSLRGLLASTARQRLASHHCRVHQVVVKMRRNRPVLTKHGTFVRARSSAKPGRSAGHRRRWTLRVQRASSSPGSHHFITFHVTIWVGWKSTPRPR
jgi:glucose/arabinose dehydrogenase